MEAAASLPSMVLTVVSFISIVLQCCLLWFGDHRDGATGTLSEADPASGASLQVELVPMPSAKLAHCLFWTGGVTSVAFETIAAGQTSLRFIARALRVEAAGDLSEGADPFVR